MSLSGRVSITLGATASSKEIWDMFWEGCLWLNGNILLEDVSFGGSLNLTSSSTNLKESQIRFCPVYGGHNHGGSTSTGPSSGHRLVKDSIKKSMFDLNELPVLWLDLFGESIQGDSGAKVTVIPSSAAITITTGFGTTTDIPLVPGDSNSDIPSGGANWDSTWTGKTYSSPLWILARPGAAGSDYAFSGLEPATPDGITYWVYFNAGTSSARLKANNWSTSSSEKAHFVFGSSWDFVV